MKVGLLVTCLIDLFRPRIGFAVLELLQNAGYEVVIPLQQTCCGQPAYNAGDRRAALALAKKTIEEFEACDYLVIPSGSCAATIKIHYAELFADEPKWLIRHQALQAKCYELTCFLTEIAQLEQGSFNNTYQGTVTYHDSCSGLRRLGVKEQPRKLLAQVPGLRLKEMAECESCCGFGGTFAIKYGALSARIAESKCRHIIAAQTDAVVLGDLGCMLNIEGRLHRQGDKRTKVLHIAQVLTGRV